MSYYVRSNGTDLLVGEINERFLDLKYSQEDIIVI